jgi:hypothetical protein
MYITLQFFILQRSFFSPGLAVAQAIGASGQEFLTAWWSLDDEVGIRVGEVFR